MARDGCMTPIAQVARGFFLDYRARGTGQAMTLDDGTNRATAALSSLPFAIPRS